MDLTDGSLKGDNVGGQDRISIEHGDRISCERCWNFGFCYTPGGDLVLPAINISKYVQRSKVTSPVSHMGKPYFLML